MHGENMKKLIVAFASVILALSFVSCGKKIDSSVWISNLADAKKAASNENKKIFLFFSADDSDESSASLKEKIFNTADFISTYTEKYVLTNLDFSDARYDSDQEGLREDMKIFERYNAKTVPYFLILSKEGYVITTLAIDANADFDSVRITISEAEETIAQFDETLAKTKTGTTEERLAAINEIFDHTDPGVAYHLQPLNKLYLSLDKNNESGECAKHLIALTYAAAADFFIEEYPEKACEEFAKLAKNKFLSGEEKQMAFYTAGYLLAQSGSTEYQTVKDYFTKAYEAAPESEDAQNIQMAINYVQMMMEGEGDEGPASVEEAPITADTAEQPVESEAVAE